MWSGKDTSYKPLTNIVFLVLPVSFGESIFVLSIDDIKANCADFQTKAYITYNTDRGDEVSKIIMVPLLLV